MRGLNGRGRGAAPSNAETQRERRRQMVNVQAHAAQTRADDAVADALAAQITADVGLANAAAADANAETRLPKNGSGHMTGVLDVRVGNAALKLRSGGTGNQPNYQEFLDANGARKAWFGMDATGDLVLAPEATGGEVRSTRAVALPGDPTADAHAVRRAWANAQLATKMADANNVLKVTHAPDNLWTAAKMASGAADARVVGDDQVRASHIRGSVRGSGGENNALRSVLNNHIGNNEITRSTVAGGTIGEQELGDSIRNGAPSVASARNTNNTGGAAAPYHVHSDLYKTWPREDRLAYLDHRSANRGYLAHADLSRMAMNERLAEMEKRLATHSAMLEAQSRIETDDPDRDAWEIEALITQDTPVARAYKNKHKMDDWEFEDPDVPEDILLQVDYQEREWRERDPRYALRSRRRPADIGRVEWDQPGADGPERRAFQRERVANFAAALEFGRDA